MVTEAKLALAKRNNGPYYNHGFVENFSFLSGEHGDEFSEGQER